MAKFAPVAPIGILESLIGKSYGGFDNFVGGYHLWIATEVEKDKARWLKMADYIHMLHGEAATIILDNGLIEVGASIDVRHLHQLAWDVRATHVVLPDVLGRSVESTRATLEGYFALQDEPVGKVFVVQGETDDAWRKGLKMLAGHCHIRPDKDFISVPRIVTDTWGMGSRRLAISYVSYYWQEIVGAKTPPIHLLGFSRNIIDDIMCTHSPLVAGIDSAVPIWLPFMLEWVVPLRLKLHYQELKRPENYWRWKELHDSSPAIQNLAWVKGWVEAVR
jgi:hypothetical protein